MSTLKQPPARNFAHQTIWTADNLDVLRGMNSDSVDLVYLDPPFNSGKQWSAPVGSEAAGASFKDAWTLSDVDLAWHGEIAEEHPALYAIIDAAGVAHGKAMKSYLIYMAVRLIELKRVLAATGSIYLHCDDTAGAYLKMTMDAVFGKDSYRNEIVWRRATSHNDPGRYGRITDSILYYATGPERRWNGDAIATPKDEAQMAASYPSSDARGRYRSDNLTGPGHGTASGNPSTMPWGRYDVHARGRVWSVPKTGAYAEWIEHEIIPGYREIEGVHERLDALDAAGLIHHPETGVWPGLKRYAAADRGTPPQNLFLEPPGFTNFRGGKERTGYPTQKPLALIERIIKASSNEGDVVLDPFCGCATACVAAEKLGRNWIGIDISPKAAELVRSRLRGELGLFYAGKHLTKPPKRTDLGDLPRYNADVNKRTLYGKQEGVCNGCRILFPYRNMTVDHVVPQSKGGGHHLGNLQLLCAACNSAKGQGTHEELIAKLAAQGAR